MTSLTRDMRRHLRLALTLAFLHLVTFSKSDDVFNLTVLHTNDVHARFDQMSKYGGQCHSDDVERGRCYGGVARRMTALRQVRNVTDHVLFLDAGDQYQGTLWFYIHKGNAAAHFMNLLQYDAMSLGNHEFDNGVDGLVPFLQAVNFPVLACNIDASSEPEIADKVKASHVFEFGNVRVGVVGFITTETSDLSSTGEVRFLDVAESIQKEVTSLKSSGVNIIIAVGHSGYPEDIAIAQNVPDVDIVIGGHTNTFLYSGPKPSTEDPEGPYPTVITNPSGHKTLKTLVIQNYAFGKYLGRLDVAFNRQGEILSWDGNPWLLDNSIEEAEDVLEEMVEWRKGVDEINSLVVGRAEVFIDGDRRSCRFQECTMGNMIADAMFYHYQTRATTAGDHAAHFAMIHGGSLRASLEPGNITLGDLKTVQPFRNTVDVVEIQGRHIREILEHSVSGYNITYGRGKFLQFSGLRVTYNIAKPDGQRVISVCVRTPGSDVTVYQPLETETVYRVAMPSFIVGGGDGYVMVEETMDGHNIYETLDVDSTREYIMQHDPVHPVLEGRIVFTNITEKFDNCDLTFNSNVRISGNEFLLTAMLFGLLLTL